MLTSGFFSRWLGRRFGAPEPAAPPIPPPAPEPGMQVSHYVIGDRLGEGGMGIVYHARDTRLDRPVALKFLPPGLWRDPQAMERLLVEARAAARLDHPNICTIHEIGKLEDGRPFIAMALYEGRTLASELRDLERLPPIRAAEIGLGVARGLERAHRAGIIHRDIKPANLFLTEDDTVKILDFGIAKLPGVDLTRSGAAIGTVAYMSPEQLAGGDLDARTDVWALGVVLYEMCAGERPFVGASEAMLPLQILELDPPVLSDLLPSVPAELSGLVGRCLEKERERRPAGAAEIRAALEDVVGLLRGAERGTAPTVARPAPPPGLVSGGERRQATVLAVRLAGRRVIEETLSPERADRLLAACGAAMAAVIERHGGVVNENSGETLEAVFGIPAAREDDTLRAVRAARELVGCLRDVAEAEPLRDRIGLRCGLDTGRVVARQDPGGDRRFRIVGGPAELGGRIASRGRAGDVLLSDPCRRLVAPFFRTEPGPSLPDDDGGPALPTHRVLHETGVRTRLEAETPEGLTALTGRDLELRALLDALDAAARGEGRLVTVTGEAGVGKSRLVLEFADRIDAERFDIARGGGVPSGGEVPYLPFIGVLRDILGLDETGAPAAPEEVVERIRSIAPDLEEFAPFYLQLLSILPSAEGGEAPPQAPGGGGFRVAMVESLAALPTLRARRRPGVVILEDWQWADAASRQVLRQLGEMVPAYPLLVVVTTRPEGERDWGATARHIALSLSPLAPEHSEAIARSVLDADEVPAPLVRLLHERTGGNPFFLEELCKGLLESGRLEVEDRRATARGSLDRLELPGTVQGVLRARLDRLDGETRRLVCYASVVGREFERGVLERALGSDEGVGERLDRLREAGLIQQIRVVPSPAYRFQHALTQEVAYEGLLDRQRSEIHGRVGEAIEAVHPERTGEQLDVLAEHFARAGEWRKAVEYGTAAADRLWSLNEFGDAIRAQERALQWAAELSGDDAFERRVELLLRQERLHEYVGDQEGQQAIIDRLLEMLDPERHPRQLATALVRLADLRILTHDHPGAEEALDAALELCGSSELDDTRRIALRSYGILRWHQDRHREAIRCVEQALELDERLGREDAIVGNLCNLGGFHRSLGEHERALEVLERALELERRLHARGDRPIQVLSKEGYILHNIANVHAARGDAATALEYLERARGRDEESGTLLNVVQMNYHLTAIARLYLQEGRVEESLDLYRESVALTRRAGHLPGLAPALRLLGDVLLNLERFEEALPALEEAAALYDRLRDRPQSATCWRDVAAAREALGQPGPALEAWTTAAERARTAGDPALGREAHQSRGRLLEGSDPDRALSAYRTALELADDDAHRGGLHYRIGVLSWRRGAYGEALAAFEAAARELDEAGDRRNRGLALNSVGRTLRDLGRLEEARDTLERAAELNREAGERLLESHALATLGDVLLDLGDPETATERFQAALRLREALGDLAGRGWMLCRLARAQAARGSAEGVAYYRQEAGEIASRTGDVELQRECEALARLHDPHEPEE